MPKYGLNKGFCRTSFKITFADKEFCRTSFKIKFADKEFSKPCSYHFDFSNYPSGCATNYTASDEFDDTDSDDSIASEDTCF